MIQGGDPTGTGRGGTSIYGKRRSVSKLKAEIIILTTLTLAGGKFQDEIVSLSTKGLRVCFAYTEVFGTCVWLDPRIAFHGSRYPRNG